MIITKTQLKKLIKEEIRKALSESELQFDKELIDLLFYDVKDMADDETIDSVYNDIIGRRELGSDGMQGDKILNDYAPEYIRLAIEHIATMPDEV